MCIATNAMVLVRLVVEVAFLHFVRVRAGCRPKVNIMLLFKHSS